MNKYIIGCVWGVLVVISMLATEAKAATKTWTGGGSTSNASEAANWGGALPVSTDDIVLDATSTKPLIWDAPSNSLSTTVASWTQNSSYSGIVTLKTTYPNYSTTFTNFVITSNLTVNGGTWKHPANTNTNAYRLAVTVGSNFTLGAAASLNVTNIGYTAGNGYGTGSSNYRGASYGGKGGAQGGTSGPTYGSVLAPVDLGSGSTPTLGNHIGGGAISLTVGGASLIYGSMLSDGNGAYNNGGGSSGGSIYLRTATLGGTGATISAIGGVDTWHGGGGGGRVALLLTQAGADFSGFTGTVSVVGSSAAYGSGAGTIYRQLGSDLAGFGMVSVSNAAGYYSYLPPTIGGALENLTGTVWRVESSAKLGIITNNYVIRALNLVGNASSLDLGSGVLVVISNLTVNSTNFTTGGYSAAQINAKVGTSQAANGYVSVGGVPIVETRSASNTVAGSTDTKGYLMATGMADTAVYVYWGDTDYTTNKASWYTNYLLAAPQAVGLLTVPVTTAFPKVYYRYYATNAMGDHWSTNSTMVSLAAVKVRASIATACKQPYTPGQFEIYRPDTDTAVTVNYTAGGTLSNGWDYTTIATNVTMGLGVSNALVNILPLGRWYTNDATVALTLSLGSYVVGSPNSATVTVSGTAAPVGTNTWLSGSPTNAGSWSLGHVPTSTEDVLLSGWGAQADMTWDSNMTHTVASWTQTTNYTNNVTLKTTYPTYSTIFTNLSITGNLNVNGGTWQPAANSTTNAYRLAVTVGSNLTLGSGVAFTAYALGYSTSNGPGAGLGDTAGGSYAGRSGYANSHALAPTYGSVLRPTDLGSGSCGHLSPGWSGGGAMWINVGATSTINGVITVEGYNPGYNNHGGGSGGSLYLKSSTISGSGTLSANGGQDGYHGGGGGGRVAVVLTGALADFTGFTGPMTSLGATNSSSGGVNAGSAAGTVYRQTGGDADGCGTVIVSNRAWGWAGSVSNMTYLPALIPSAESLTGTSWRVEGYGRLGISTNNYVIRGLMLAGANGVLDLGSNVLVAVSNLVVNGTNFSSGGYSAAQINAKVGTLQIANGGYVSVGGGPIVETWASTNENLQGYLMATGTAATTVYLYWGGTDCGTNKNLWYTNTVLAAPQAIGPLNVPVSAPFSHVYYRFYATNAAGDHWATTNGLFLQSMTLTASAPVPTASKQPYAAGQFQISRVDTSTSVAVNYSISGTLSNGLDYAWLTNALTMNAGQSNATLNVLPMGRWYTNDQTVILSLGAGSYVVGSPNSATVTVSGTAAPDGTNTWLGGTPTLASSWSSGHVPTNTDSILLGGWGAQGDLTWDSTMTHTVASWTQTTNFANTVTLMTTFPGYSTVFTNLTVAGDMTVNGGVWCHAANSNQQAYRLALTVGGNLTMGSNALFNLSGLGYCVSNGPGTGTGLNGRGASYGGKGGFDVATPGPTYGSVFAPADLGTGGGELPLAITNFGGGAGWINVGGTSSINGTIAANGLGSCNTGGGGSGGSIYLRAGNLSGGGVVCANGGNDTWHGSGGGGRVAVVLTQAGADFTGFTGTILALGNGTNGYAINASQGAAAGTVYRQSGSDAMGYGTVTVSNVQWAAGTTASQGNRTHLPPMTLFADNLKNTKWIAQTNGLLQLTANTQINVLTMNVGSGLDLAGYTLTVIDLVITNRVYYPGIYTTNTLGTAMVTGSGTLIVQPSGTAYLIR